MGYRSDVGIKCEQRAFDEFKKAYEENEFPPDYIYRTDDDVYTIIWENTKWYEDYPEVSAIRDVMATLDDLNDDTECPPDGYGYSFIRIGEDYDDNERMSNTWDLNFYIERSFPREGIQIGLD